MQILTEPKNALVRQYQRMFELDGVELEFEHAALEAIADLAVLRKTGARGLRAILEEVLGPIMFEVPSRASEVARRVVTPRGRARERGADDRARTARVARRSRPEPRGRQLGRSRPRRFEQRLDHRIPAAEVAVGLERVLRAADAEQPLRGTGRRSRG